MTQVDIRTEVRIVVERAPADPRFAHAMPNINRIDALINVLGVLGLADGSITSAGDCTHTTQASVRLDVPALEAALESMLKRSDKVRAARRTLEQDPLIQAVRILDSTQPTPG